MLRLRASRTTEHTSQGPWHLLKCAHRLREVAQCRTPHVSLRHVVMWGTSCFMAPHRGVILHVPTGAGHDRAWFISSRRCTCCFTR
jgi:hypothetical protein